MRQMKKWIPALLVLSMVLGLTGCLHTAERRSGAVIPTEQDAADRYLRIVEEEGTNVDPQCTTGYYTVALNIFDRLVEIETADHNSSRIVPSLAESWTVSEDGLTYSFHLHKGVSFSNGSELTSSDVLYTFRRLLTCPDSCNQDIAMPIKGARELHQGQTDVLEGFQLVNDTDFVIELQYPYAAFLANLSTPGASIFDEESTELAGARFGIDPSATIGTGPFVFREYVKGDHILLDANPGCWSGAPRCDGLRILFTQDAEEQRLMFQRGELDILDLEAMGSDAEYFIQGDIYQQQLCSGPRVGISYVALNASCPPLDDARVRKALQLALDRKALMTVYISGRGSLENGIFPHGLIGYNEKLPEIPYDPDEARSLLRQAGYPDGFALPIYVENNTSVSRQEMLTLIAYLWQKVGIQAEVKVLDEDDFLTARKQGKLTCYSSTWSADFNDPDNFIYTFFGNEENTCFRSLCYADRSVMERVARARSISDETARIAEYQALEEKIVQEDAAWIPLFSSLHYFVVNSRVDGFRVSWNGWSSNQYRNVSVSEGQ